MASTTSVVRAAISTLGIDAADKEIKAYIRRNNPDAPQGQINLVLRKIRPNRPEPKPLGLDRKPREPFSKD